MTKHANVALFVPHLGCHHKCSFCNQNTISGVDAIPHAEDVKAACEQALNNGVDVKNTEIAFFGGSFTAVPRNYMLELLSAAKPYVDVGFSGIRCSTRPDAVDDEVLGMFKSYGGTAVELGVQSMCDDVLLANERGHSSLDVVNAAKCVKSNNLTLGLQMMVGLYRSTPEKDIETAKQIIALKPDEVRIYPVVILKNTKLGRLYQIGEYVPYSLDLAVKTTAKLLDMFEDAGVNVIKCGLHSSTDVENDMLGGLYHPAFRELCESERFFNLMLDMLNGDKCAHFTVNSKDISKALGQKRSNISRFSAMGVNVEITQSQQNKRLLRVK